MSNSVLPRLREVGDDEVTAWMARFDEHGVTYRASDAARLRLHLAGGLSAKTLEAAMQDRLANCDARPDLTRVLVAADLLRMAADGSSTAASTRLMVEALEEWGQMAAYRRVKEARDAEVASVVDNWDAIAAAEKFAVERPQRITRFFLGTHALVADTLAGLQALGAAGRSRSGARVVGVTSKRPMGAPVSGWLSSSPSNAATI